MPALDRLAGVKLPPDALASIQRDLRVSRESEEDVALLRQGLRLVNRQGNRRKDKFILDALADDRSLEGAHDDDFRDEAEVRWAWDTGALLSHDLKKVVEMEIKRAFEMAGLEPPVICNVHAETILYSDFQAKLLEGSAPEAVTPALVDAHLRALGYPWPARVRTSCARRVAVALMNLHLWEASWPTTTDEEPENEAQEIT